MVARAKCQQQHESVGLWAARRRVCKCTAGTAACTINTGSGERMHTDGRHFLPQQQQNNNKKNDNKDDIISAIWDYFNYLCNRHRCTVFTVTTIIFSFCDLSIWIKKYSYEVWICIFSSSFLTFTKYISSILFSIPRQQNPFSQRVFGFLPSPYGIIGSDGWSWLQICVLTREWRKDARWTFWMAFVRLQGHIDTGQ